MVLGPLAVIAITCVVPQTVSVWMLEFIVEFPAANHVLWWNGKKGSKSQSLVV
jgi:hypothetical protein